MHIAQVTSWDRPPTYTTGPALPPPTPTQVRLKILAAAVHRLVQMRAARQHFSATTLPLDPSSDGVGLDEATGKTYYIGTFAAPVFADYANVERARLAELPPGTDPVKVAVLCNSVTAGWMSLAERIEDLPAGFSVLVIGATGTSGRAAVPVAKEFGAGRVVGMARNEAALKGVAGLDGYIVQREPVEETDFSSLGQIDVILDFVYGKAAIATLLALKTERMTQYVNVGTVGAEETIALPAQLLRSKMLRMTGSAPGSYPLSAMGKYLASVVKFAAGMELPPDVFSRPLAEIESVWNSDEAKKKRLVLIP